MTTSEVNKRYYQNHKERIKKATNKYYKSHREIVCARQAKRNASNKLEVIKHYSNNGILCCLCGETCLDCLTIDHINNDGNRHRKEINRIGSSFYKWLIDNNFPSGYQVLCANCNLKKEIVRKREKRGMV